MVKEATVAITIQPQATAHWACCLGSPVRRDFHLCVRCWSTASSGEITRCLQQADPCCNSHQAVTERKPHRLHPVLPQSQRPTRNFTLFKFKDVLPSIIISHFHDLIPTQFTNSILFHTPEPLHSLWHIESDGLLLQGALFHLCTILSAQVCLVRGVSQLQTMIHGRCSIVTLLGNV